MLGEQIRLLLVEDSPTAQYYLQELLVQAGFVVTGVASTVHQAEMLARASRPDLVLSDVRLPDGNGIDLARRIMGSHPLPIILITAYDASSPELVFQAMNAGALEVLPKPPAKDDPKFKAYYDVLVKTIRTLAGIPVVHRGKLGKAPVAPKSRKIVEKRIETDAPIIAIGASTGGPNLVADLVREVKKTKFHYAVIAQHMVPEFLEGFRQWIRISAGCDVEMAVNGATPERGRVYLPPPHMHLQLTSEGTWKVLTSSAIASPHIPSINTLFQSLASECGKEVIAFLLTGMGRDGASGLKALKDAGAFTIVQDPRTAVIPGMPSAALELDAACAIQTPADMLTWIQTRGK